MQRRLFYLLVAILTLAGFLPGGLVSIAPSSALAATPPEVQWAKTFGGTAYDNGQCVQPTADGGYIITGHTMSFGTGNNIDVYLIKTDASGNMTWQKTFGGGLGNSVQQTVDGGYIIAGYTESFGAGNGDVYLIKTDGTGNLTWQNTFGGSNFDYGCCVKQTVDGGYIVGGSTNSSGVGAADVYLIKTDTSGNMTWSRTFGGADSDVGRYVQQTADGGYIIAGRTGSFSNSDVYLIKTDAYGNMTWQQTFGGTDEDTGYSVHVTDDGGYIIAGYTFSFGVAKLSLYLIKTDASGNMTWQQTFAGTGGVNIGYSVETTTDGGYIIAGETGFGQNDVYLVKTDASGNLTWQKTFGGTGNDAGYSVQTTGDGGCIIVGRTTSFGAGGDDVYLIKVSPATANIPGDANGDSAVNALDITKIERIIIGLDAPTPGADANQDGNVNALDITMVERIIAGLAQ